MQNKYSIKDLEHLSGIKAHTIRAWESRYGLIEPYRTDTNIRYYVDEHLKKILNTSTLIKAGVKISKIAQMTDDQIREAVANSGRYESNFTTYINSLKTHMLEFDERGFDAVISKCIVSYGAEKALTEVIGPFIKEVGILWQIGVAKVSHEHFASNLLRMKLFALIDQNFSSQNASKSNSYILFLPSGELRELSLLYLYYHLIVNGNRVVYLGQSLPLEYLMEVSNKTGITNFISVITTNPHQDAVVAYLEKVGVIFHNSGCKLRLVGEQVAGIENEKIPIEVSVFEDFESLKVKLVNEG